MGTLGILCRRFVHNASRTPANPGMTAGTFRAVFEPAEGRRMRFKYRWDWHLRNFLTAMIPPGVLFSFLQFVKYKYEQEGIALDDVFEGDGVEEIKARAGGQIVRGNGESNEQVEGGLEMRLRVLEEELREIRERERERERSERIESARRIAKESVMGRKNEGG